MSGEAPVSPNSCTSVPGCLQVPRNKKPRQTGFAGVDGGLDAHAVIFGGGSWMSLQPGSNRLLPLGAVMRLHRWVGWYRSPRPACEGYSGDLLTARRAGANTHEAFQWRWPSPCRRPERPLCDLKGRREPTNGNLDAARPQALWALGFPLAKRSNGRMKPDVYNQKCL